MILPALQVPLPAGALEHSDILRRDRCLWCVFGPRFVTATTLTRALTPSVTELGLEFRQGIGYSTSHTRSGIKGHKHAIRVCVLSDLLSLL